MIRNLLLTILLSQLLIIIILSYQIYKKADNILGTTTIIPIKNVVQNSLSNLDFFYEPPANFVEVVPEEITFSDAKYTLNSDTLNERFNYSIQKESSAFRIITLGDSFTFGMFVNTQDNWTEQLENLLNTNIKCRKIKKFEIINLANYGYDIQHSLERYRIRGQKYNPDLILWFLKDDDFEQINEIMRIHEKKYLAEMKESGEFEDLMRGGNGYPPNIKMHRDMKSYINKVGQNKILDLQENYLKSLNEYFHGSLIIFTLPNTQNQFKEKMQEFAYSRPNTHFFDDISNIYELNNAVFPDGHPNVNGHQIIAKDLFNYLTENKLIPCK